MARFSTNINNKGYKAKEDTEVTWEVIRNHEYQQDSLLTIMILYTLRLATCNYTESSEEESSTIIARITITRDCAFFNKPVIIEILNGVFLCKFTSKRKNHSLRLQDLYQELCKLGNMVLPKEIEDSFLREYQESVQSFKK